MDTLKAVRNIALIVRSIAVIILIAATWNNRINAEKSPHREKGA